MPFPGEVRTSPGETNFFSNYFISTKTHAAASTNATIDTQEVDFHQQEGLSSLFDPRSDKVDHNFHSKEEEGSNTNHAAHMNPPPPTTDTQKGGHSSYPFHSIKEKNEIKFDQLA